MSDFAKLRQYYFEKNGRYQDQQFLTEASRLFYHQTSPAEFEWRRPTEITGEPKFVIDDIKQFDIGPGRYGDSWLVSVLGVLYQYRGLFYRAVPADQGFTKDYQYAGVFHFRFWWAGEWTEVIVDDRLPTVNGQLTFIQSHKSGQFWASLLEKAYAKLHGSYEALKYVSSVDAFNELTGGTTESIILTPDDQCIRFLARALKTTTIPTAVANSENHSYFGIVPGRNYCLCGMDIVHVSDGSTFTLVKARLSPNTPQYTGAWATPESPEWKQVSSKEKDRLGLKHMQSNEFWIDWKTFCNVFNRLEIVYLDADTCQSEQRFRQTSLNVPHVKIFQSCWKRGSTAGGCRNHVDTFHINPQILLTIAQSEEVLVALLQHHAQDPRVIGFSIYKTNSTSPQNQILPSTFFRSTKALCHSTYSNSRQVVTRVYLEAGSYVVVPTTYDIGQEGAFTLRVYSFSTANLSLLDTVPSITKSPIIEAAPGTDDYKEMFLSFADENQTITAYELQELLHNCLPNDYMKSSASLDVCKRVVAAFQPSHQIGRIGYERFKNFICSLKIWQETFSFYSKTTSGVMKAEKLRESLSDVGFALNTDLMHLLLLRYMRRDGTLRFGDFVACILHLISAFNTFSRKDASHAGFVKLNSADWMKAVLKC